MKRIFITIYIVMIIGLLTIPFGIVPIIDEIFKDQVTEAERDLARGTFALIAQRLEGLDKAGQDEELARIAPLFGYPVTLQAMDQLDVDPEDIPDFKNGLIVSHSEEDMLIQRLGASDRAMTMGGPFPGNRIDAQAQYIFWGLFLLFLALPAFAWTFFLQHDLKKIQKTTAQFAAGDHTARVKVSRISSFSQVAVSINTMAEQTQKLLESQKDLSNSVSHEIRTPLARIKFSLEMIAEFVNTAQQGSHYLSEIGRDVEEIESLVDEMLTYARFDREPEKSGDLNRHEMISWLDAIVETEQKGIREKALSFEKPVDKTSLISRFEPVYLGWAIRNLIRNAVKYARNRIAVTIEEVEGNLLIHVDDDGPGIPESSREKIFQPFFRIDSSRSRKSGNYGLGLAIAKRISRWHKGSIHVGLSPWNGARFTITLPMDPMDSVPVSE
ncbi:MAG: hypothetical protein D3926_14855 [Desulfobacteraceae bacterium]|nr:MAG: hypothetical protein D3926_14855 [Desulfobacteraceae bacterium]